MAALRPLTNTITQSLQFALFVFCLAPLVDAGNAPLPAYPLAVRNPYLSAWISRKYTNSFPTATTAFWDGQELGWEVMARVNNESYTLFGFPSTPPHATPALQNSVTFTSTHTLVTLTAGGVEFLLDFFSPVDPTDMLRQSLPFSYLTIGATSTTAKSNEVQIYSAINDAWAGDAGPVVANLTQNEGASMFIVQNEQQMPFQELHNMATWGQVAYGFLPQEPSSLSYACGTSPNVYGAFIAGGSAFTKSAPTCGNNEIYAFQYDLGQVGGKTVNSTFAIGNSREEVVKFNGQIRTGYAASAYPTVAEATTAFLKDYDAAYKSSTMIDETVRQEGETISANYADILEASVRQTFGTIEITIDSNTLDLDDPLIFAKEISSDGNVNTIDYLYDCQILFYILDPSYIRYFLEPVLRYLNGPGPKWTLNYMIHDIGTHYPIANGYDNNQEEVFFGRPEDMPLASSADAITMVLAYQRATGDNSWAKQYQTLLTTYADYMAANYSVVVPELSAVDALWPAGNSTTLTIASAIGLGAFSEIYSLPDYRQKALAIADEYYTQGKGLNRARTHFTYQNGRSEYDNSWAVMYPMYMDKLLNLNVFPQAAYDMMANFYSTVLTKWGMAYKNGVEWGITDWNMWVSAVVPDPLQQQIIDATHSFLIEPHNQKPFQTKYGVLGGLAGQAIANVARGTVSANFAILAMKTGTWWDKTVIGNGTGTGSATQTATGDAKNGSSNRKTSAATLPFVADYFLLILQITFVSFIFLVSW